MYLPNTAWGSPSLPPDIRLIILYKQCPREIEKLCSTQSYSLQPVVTELEWFSSGSDKRLWSQCANHPDSPPCLPTKANCGSHKYLQIPALQKTFGFSLLPQWKSMLHETDRVHSVLLHFLNLEEQSVNNPLHWHVQTAEDIMCLQI